MEEAGSPALPVPDVPDTPEAPGAPGAPGSVVPASWAALRQFTRARIALGRAGHSLPTAPHLAFQLAHALARDAVHLPFDAAAVARDLEALGLAVLRLQSAAPDRATYLQRPDLGRRLSDGSRAALAQPDPGAPSGASRADVVFVVGDGLSAQAVHRHAAPLVAAVLERLRASGKPWTVGPVALVENARVAVGDEVGAGLRARCVVVLIGERPGLSSPDSLGVYLTWDPQPGLTDARRNCISNVRPEGLPVAAAAAKLVQLLEGSRELQTSGVALKDDSDDDSDDQGEVQLGVPGRSEDPARNFLLGP